MLGYSRKSKIAGDQLSRKSNRSAKKDDYDDLEDMLFKDSGKNMKKKEKEFQPHSSTHLDLYQSSNDFKRTTEKWSTPNIDINPIQSYKNESPRFPRSRKESIEDRSEDARSFKSGAPGRQHQF